MGRLDELLRALAAESRPARHFVSHESSNLASLVNGFADRPHGISFARAPHERMSSPRLDEPVGQRGIVYATVSGPGVDYSSSHIREILDAINADAIERAGTTAEVLPALRKSGVSWVNNWDSIGEAPELHALMPEHIQVRRILELPKGVSYRFPTPPPEPFPRRVYEDPGLAEAYQQRILPVRRSAP